MAGGFSEEWLNKVRDASDIVDIVSSYVNLAPKGRRYWGCCPFHHEKTPSFSVSADKQMFYCFGCHEGGNVFTFLTKIEKFTFMEAAKYLAERASIPMEEINNDDYAIARARSERLYELNKLAAKFFYDNLRTPEAKEAGIYLKKRGVDEGLVNRFGLGYAPNARDEFIKHAKNNSFTADELVSAGLAVNRDGNLTDMFRNRVIFPIINQYGRVIAFGGRVLDDSKPKYLNSPDTPIYNKRRNLYAINLVKKRKNIDRILLVEGYMDVIALHQQGYDYTVASLGTALTGEQVAYIRRLTSNIYIAYDGDDAGRNATLKALEIVRKAGANAKVVSLPDLDPDDFIKKKGKPAFDELLESAQNEVDYKINLARKDFDFSTAEGKKGFAIKAAAILKLIADPIELEDYIRKISAQTGFSQDVIMRQVASSDNHINVEQRVVNEKTITNKNDWHIIRIIMKSSELLEYFISQNGAELLDDNMCKEVLNFIILRKKAGKSTTNQDILNEFTNSEYSKDVSALLFNDFSYTDMKRFLLDCIAQIKLNRMKQKRKYLAVKISELSDDDLNKSIELLQEIKELDISIANCEKV